MDPKARNAIALVLVGGAIVVGVAWAMKPPPPPSPPPSASAPASSAPPPVAVTSSSPPIVPPAPKPTSSVTYALSADPKHLEAPVPAATGGVSCTAGSQAIDEKVSEVAQRGCVRVDPKTGQLLHDGPWTFTSADGTVVAGRYDNGKLEGTWVTWSASGKATKSEDYKDGALDGWQIEWTEAGQRLAEHHFKNGALDGDTTMWLDDGTVIHQVWREGKRIDVPAP